MKYALWLYGLVLVCVFCSLRTAASAQDSVPVEFVGRVLPAYIENGDTIPYEHIFEVVIVPRRTFRNERELRAYRRMIANLKKVYPYAQEAKRLLREMDSVYGGLDSRAAKARYASQMERKLNRQFEKQIRNLTYSQGRMLIKLINRETGRTTYDIIKQFRGGLSAGFWQIIAKMFGSDLKSGFDPVEEDRILNELIILYEHGQL